jgi:hypothetical protein
VSRTYRNTADYTFPWNGFRGVGRWYKRRYHKAVRKYVKGTGGKERSVAHWRSEINWKGT